MSGLESVASQIELLLTTARSHGPLARSIADTVRQTVELQGRLAEVLNESDNEHAQALQGAVGAIALGLRQIYDQLPALQHYKEDLFASWQVNISNTPLLPHTTSPASPRAQSTEHGPTFTNEWTDVPTLNPKGNYFNPSIQMQLDTPLDTLFTADAVGEAAQQRIMGSFRRRGQVTVRDVLSTGGIVVANTLGKGPTAALRKILSRACPAIPLRGNPTAMDIARFNTSLDQIPIQAILPNYVHSNNKHQTVTDLFDLETNKLRTDVRQRFQSTASVVENKIKTFVEDFTSARQRLAEAGLDSYTPRPE